MFSFKSAKTEERPSSSLADSTASRSWVRSKSSIRDRTAGDPDPIFRSGSDPPPSFKIRREESFSSEENRPKTDSFKRFIGFRMRDRLFDRKTEKMIDKMSYQMTDRMTNKTTNRMTDRMTDKMTVKMTDKMTDYLTDRMTDKMSEKKQIGSKCPKSWR
jgi:hypothetical protein